MRLLSDACDAQNVCMGATHHAACTCQRTSRPAAVSTAVRANPNHACRSVVCALRACTAPWPNNWNSNTKHSLAKKVTLSSKPKLGSKKEGGHATNQRRAATAKQPRQVEKPETSAQHRTRPPQLRCTCPQTAWPPRADGGAPAQPRPPSTARHSGAVTSGDAGRDAGLHCSTVSIAGRHSCRER